MLVVAPHHDQVRERKWRVGALGGDDVGGRSSGRANLLQIDAAFAGAGDLRSVHKLFGTVLIRAYCKQERAALALRLFEEMRSSRLAPDGSTKALLVRSLHKEGKLREAGVDFSSQLSSALHSFTLPLPISDLYALKDQKTFAAALDFSWRTNSPHLGFQIHGQIIKSGFPSATFSQNNLLTMYSKCRKLDCAAKMFDEMPERNLISWTSMISGLVHNNKQEMALELYVEMVRSGVTPNEFTLACLLSACATIGWFKLGSSLHLIALKIGLNTNRFVGSTLLWMYAKCGNIEATELAFECIFDPDLACWNALSEGYALNRDSYSVIKSLSFVCQAGMIPDQYTYISALKGCVLAEDLSCGRQVHCLVMRSEFECTTTVMNSLTDMYFKAGRKSYALRLFNQIQDKNTSSWNTIISGLSKDEDETEVMNLFSSMLISGVRPDQVTFSILIRFCGATSHLLLGLQFCCVAFNLGYFNHHLVVSSLINLFSKCGVMDSAELVFTSHPFKNTVMCNEMIAAYTSNGNNLKALQVFRSLIEFEIEADEFTYSNILGACQGIQHQNKCEQAHARIIKHGFDRCCSICSSMIHAYASFGLIKSCFTIFQDIRELDLVSWGAMISAFVRLGFSRDSLSLLNSFRNSGEKPDEVIFSSALNACANVGLLVESSCIHADIVKAGFEDHSSVASAMVDAYAKCGDIESSRIVFKNISRDHNDAILFNTMITAYAHHGLIIEAIELFKQMKSDDFYPTHATFVSVIGACSHLGLVEQGKHVFDSISNVYGMHPSADNFACLVDLFARNGLLEKAKGVVESMPYEPWPEIWISLLSGCRTYGNKEMAELAAENILKLMPNNDSAYALLANLYAGDAKWKDAERLRIKMDVNRVQKPCGYSVIAT